MGGSICEGVRGSVLCKLWGQARPSFQACLFSFFTSTCRLVTFFVYLPLKRNVSKRLFLYVFAILGMALNAGWSMSVVVFALRLRVCSPSFIDQLHDNDDHVQNSFAAEQPLMRCKLNLTALIGCVDDSFLSPLLSACVCVCVCVNHCR